MRITGSIISLLAVLAVVIFASYQLNEAEAGPKLSIETIKERIRGQYPGDIKEVALDPDAENYYVVTETEARAYKIIIDGNTSKILQIDETDLPERKKAKGTEAGKVAGKEKEGAANEEKEENTVKSADEENRGPKKQAIISSNDALEIALREFAGTVEEVELEEDNGSLHYEVEIENGEMEADIQVDAYTGKIIIIEIDD